MKKRLLAVVGELDAIDGMLDDVFDIRIRQLVDPDGKPPAAYHVPWMRLLLQAKDRHPGLAQLIGHRRAGRSHADYDHVIALGVRLRCA